MGTEQRVRPGESVVLSPENPWPGLVSFSENNQAFFFGREAEIAELLRRVTQEPLTIFFGRSGLGKSSILQAGLSPRLRQSGFVPIHVRLDYSEAAQPLVTQIFGQITHSLESEKLDAPRPQAEQSLWEYFHQSDCDWWSESNELVRPVLLFDQFEELLTLGMATSDRLNRLQTVVTDLEDLVDNRVPAPLERRLSAEKGLAKNFDFNRSPCNVVLALREDFLADLESLHEGLRPIMRNRYRLLPMSQKQALDVVLKPGRHLVGEDVARAIVRFVSSADQDEVDESSEFSDAHPVEPALLSVVLQELNNRRIQRAQPRITEELFDQSNASNILQDFYERAIRHFEPPVREFVVDCLLTSSGARNRIAEEDALTKPGVSAEVLAGLIDRRIIQRQVSGHTKWLELTHDTLAEVVRRDRAESQQRRAVAAAKASEEAAHRALRRTQRLVAVFACLVLAVLVGIVFGAVQRQRLRESQIKLDKDRELQDRDRELQKVQERELDQRRNQLQQQGVKLDLQQNELIAKNAQLIERNADITERDQRLREDAEAQANHDLDALWVQAGTYQPGQADRVQAQLAELGTDAVRFPGSDPIRRAQAWGRVFAAQAFYLSGYIGEGYEAVSALGKQPSMSTCVPADEDCGVLQGAVEYGLGRGELDEGRIIEAEMHLTAAARDLSRSTGGIEAKRRALAFAGMTELALGELAQEQMSLEQARAHYTRVSALARQDASGSDLLRVAEIRAALEAVISKDYEPHPHGFDDLRDGFTGARSLADRLMNSRPENLLWRMLFIEASYQEAFTALQYGDYTEASSIYRVAKAPAEGLYAADHTPQNALLLALVDRGLAEYFNSVYQLDNANLFFDDAFQKVRASTSAERSWERAGQVYGLTLMDYAVLKGQTAATDAKASAGKKNAAEERAKPGSAQWKIDRYLEALRILGALSDADPGNAVVDSQAEQAALSLARDPGGTQTKPCQKQESGRRQTDDLNRARSLLNRMSGHERPFFQRAEAQLDVQEAYYGDEPLKCTAKAQEALAIYRRLMAAGQEEDLYSEVADAYFYLGIIDLQSGKRGEAQSSFDSSLSSLDQGIARGSGSTDRVRLSGSKAQREMQVAFQWRGAQEYEKAIACLSDSISLLQTELRKDLLRPDLYELVRQAKAELEQLQTAIKTDKQHTEEENTRLLVKVAELSRRSNADLLSPQPSRPNVEKTILLVDNPQSWRLPPLIPGPWVQLPDEQFEAELKRLSAGSGREKDLVSDIKRIRRVPVSFYPDAALYEAEVKTKSRYGILEYVRSGDHCVMLDGTSTPIHKFDQTNVQEGTINTVMLHLDTEEQATQYLLFFLAAVTSDDGNFRIISTPEDLVMEADATASQRKELNRLVRPLTVRRNADGKWAGVGTVRSGDGLFYSILSIDPATLNSNTVAMNDDQPVASGQAFLDEFFDDDLRVSSGYVHQSSVLAAKIRHARDSREWPEAVGLEQELITLTRKSPVSRSRRSSLLGNEYVGLSWYDLMRADYAAALAASEEGLKSNPDSLPLDTNRAHALLLLGRTAEAEKLYRSHIGQKIDEKTWQAVILEDLTALEQNGASNPHFVEIRTMMQSAH